MNGGMVGKTSGKLVLHGLQCFSSDLSQAFVSFENRGFAEDSDLKMKSIQATSGKMPETMGSFHGVGQTKLYDSIY